VIDGNDVLSQSIWLNSHIKVNNTSPCLKNWIEKDMYIINDLLDQNKQIMSYEIFQDTYHVDTTFVQFYGIISTIPRHWKHLINTCHNLIYKENKFIHQLQIDPKPCKYFYRQFIDKNTIVPVNIINKWSNEFDIEETEWGLIFSESFLLSKNNKLSCFQYQLIHRIFALNRYLYKRKIKETELFPFAMKQNKLINTFWGTVM
jgi:hypothetical protein